MGLVPAAAIWVTVLAGLGIAVGVPAARYLHQAEDLFGRIALVGFSLLASLVVLRLARAPDVGSANRVRPGVLRLGAAIGLDVVIVGAVGAATSSTLTGAIGLAMALSLTLLIYVAGTRLALGSTPGSASAVSVTGSCCLPSPDQDAAGGKRAASALG